MTLPGEGKRKTYWDLRMQALTSLTRDGITVVWFRLMMLAFAKMMLR